MIIEHLAIWTEDIERVRQFYMKYFEMNCSEKYFNPKRNYSSYFLAFPEGKTRIELMHIPTTTHPSAEETGWKGLAHFAITVGSKEAVNTLTERFRADGYTIASEPRTTGDGYYESSVLDPEGNLVEICA